MSVKYPIPSMLNLGISLVWLVVSVACLWGASHGGIAVKVLCVIVFSFVMQTGFSLLHEAEHDKLHENPGVNYALGWLAAALFPGSYAFLRAAHLAHHRNNRSDLELVDYVLPHQSRVIKTLQYYFLVCGGVYVGVPVISLILCFLPDGLVDREGGRLPGGALNYLRSIATAKPSRVRREMLGVVLFWVGLVWGLGLMLVPTLACYTAFAFSWSSQQYIYHIRTPRHLIEGAYNLALWKPVSLLYLKFNFHLSHHLDVRVPWIWMDRFGPGADRGYLATYVALWGPPELVCEAWPRELQVKGPLLERGREG